MDIRMIALDLDGTTLNSDGRLSDINKETIEEAIDKGIHVVVASGRVLAALPEEVVNIKGLQYSITSNGARVTDLKRGESIYDNCISCEVIDRVVEIALDRGLSLEAFWDDTAYIDAVFYRDIEQNGCPFRNREYVLRTRNPRDDFYEAMMANKNKIENINIFFDDLEYLESMRGVFETIPNCTITSSIKNNIEVGGATTSKADAVEHLAGMLGVESENIMCFGDAPNDIKMIEYAGFGVAVGNAWGGTADHADYVAESNDDSGVGLTIRKFAL